MTIKTTKQEAEFFIQLRWIGAPFFILGAIWFLFAMQQASQGGTWFAVGLGLASCLMGLTCFGLNHDTAIEQALKYRKEDPSCIFSEQLEREISYELHKDTAQALALKGHPTLGKVLPLIVLCVHCAEIFLLFFKS